jgi:hypothetical protein
MLESTTPPDFLVFGASLAFPGVCIFCLLLRVYDRVFTRPHKKVIPVSKRQTYQKAKEKAKQKGQKERE